jgi:excisionase family DNA binding protein
MHFSIKDIARVLGVGENEVRKHIDSGRLTAERIGEDIRVTESELQRFLDTERKSGEKEILSNSSSAPSPPPRGGPIEPILDHLSNLGREIREKWDFIRENKQLEYELRQKELLLAQREMDIQNLQKELEHQKELYAKEMEALERILQEKWALMEKETEKRVALEREELEKYFALEKELWSTRLKEEKERYVQKLNQVQQKESFWSRLMRMMTWS